ncbi:L-lactate dehydrogenase complex protein LldG [Lacibacter cauensis]|uniref:L-lactate dehydrogenase complex protein LldG n=1 Tax=Lacibacter cauensis TaxID=510947 RepID=A0A562SVW9_9BACT|nr:LUD domain-containing protein [Lacibacter cauensis]TWI85439.1 L-lactate dehydrogenase complex protein LldG [Lacibacter cauensis]
MSARETILKNITANKPELVELPSIDLNAVIQYSDLVQQYKTVLQSIGGGTVELQNLASLKQELESRVAKGDFVVNRIAALGEVSDSLASLTADELAAVDTAYLQGAVAVAENGAIWLYESQMGNRLLPFICQHLVIVIERKNIVPTMHHAYKQIESAKEGFGVFLAGPSKTADIEQSLVIGAHGARSLIVYIIG